MLDFQEILVSADSVDTSRQEGHRLIDQLAQALEGPRDKVINYVEPEIEYGYLKEKFESAGDFDLADFWQDLMSRSVDLQHPHYLGHQVATPLPLTTLVSALISQMNNSTTLYELAMVGNAMERVVIEYLAEQFAYPAEASGFITSGGSMGNLTALLTARETLALDPADYHRLAIMVSEQAHYSVKRAAHVLGIPADNILKVPSDSSFRVRTDCLEVIYQEATARSLIVFCLVGCAGTTAVGAYDDLEALADFSHKHRLWFHVDAAHGGAVVFSKKYGELLQGIEQSDSLILDFHKMLMTSALSTAILFNP